LTWDAASMRTISQRPTWLVPVKRISETFRIASVSATISLQITHFPTSTCEFFGVTALIKSLSRHLLCRQRKYVCARERVAHAGLDQNSPRPRQLQARTFERDCNQLHHRHLFSGTAIGSNQILSSHNLALPTQFRLGPLPTRAPLTQKPRNS